MKEVVIKDIKRKTNLNRKVLKQTAISAYAALAKKDVPDKDARNRREDLQDKIRSW